MPTGTSRALYGHAGSSRSSRLSLPVFVRLTVPSHSDTDVPVWTLATNPPLGAKTSTSTVPAKTRQRPRRAAWTTRAP